MTAKKHTLTTAKDTITGTSGIDQFLAPLKIVNGQMKQTLTDADVLKGGGGMDELIATVSSNALATHLSSIEKATLSRTSTSAFNFDMASISGLNTLIFKNFASSATVADAGALATVKLENVKSDTFTINSIDSSKVSKLYLAATNAESITLGANSKTGADFGSVDISLSDTAKGSGVKLKGDVASAALLIHSNGTADNELTLDPKGNAQSIKSLTLTGKADLELKALGANTLSGLKTLSASAMTGDLTLSFGSTSLNAGLFGNGDDHVSLSAIGKGFVNSPAIIQMGEGNDFLDLTKLSIEFKTEQFFGDGGVDTVRLAMNPGSFTAANFDFEKFEIDNPYGKWTFGSSVQSVKLLDGSKDTDALVLNFATGPVALTGSSQADYFNIGTLGGSTGSKSTINLGAGNDTVALYGNLLQQEKQTWNGGTGTDTLALTGDLPDLNKVKGFEKLDLWNFQGNANLMGTGIADITLHSPGPDKFSTVLTNIVDGATIHMLDDIHAGLVLLLADRNLQNNSLTLDLQNSVKLGDSEIGVSMEALDNLKIVSNGADELWIKAIGNDVDAARITITGTGHLTLGATSDSFQWANIDEIRIENTGGTDMTNIERYQHTLSLEGATIIGGAGDDRLIGGYGKDAIFSGGGDDEIFGSDGADAVTLATNSGQDTLFYTSISESRTTDRDDIFNFGVFDAVDLHLLVDNLSLDALFAGNVANITAGKAKLSLTKSVAFFDQNTDVFYLDVNHDKAITSADLAVHLVDVSALNTGQILF